MSNDDTKARLAELAARAEAATSAIVRPTDAELGQARAWAARVGHRWAWDAARRMSHDDATTLARVVSWLLAERVLLRRVAAVTRQHVPAGDYRELDAVLAELAAFDGKDPQLSLLGGEGG
jgi:hypothetical protein